MSTLGKSTYHHGDLRAALITAATESLEAGDAFSMRAVARRAGVSAAAPYRHFADREALESAVAVDGFTQLHAALSAALSSAPTPGAIDAVTALGTSYVRFALEHPAVFRLMFGNECDDANDERVVASAALHDLLQEVTAELVPDAPSEQLAVALWSMAHGLAFLHLDGKFRAEPFSDVAERVRESVDVMFSLGRG